MLEGPANTFGINIRTLSAIVKEKSIHKQTAHVLVKTC